MTGEWVGMALDGDHCSDTIALMNGWFMKGLKI